MTGAESIRAFLAGFVPIAFDIPQTLKGVYGACSHHLLILLTQRAVQNQES